MSHFGSNYQPGYVSGSGHIQYPPDTTTYPSYSRTYMPDQIQTGGYTYMPNTAAGMMPYHVRPPPRNATLPSQHCSLPQSSYYSSVAPAHHSNQSSYRYSLDQQIAETEDQDSPNNTGLRSEPLVPPLEGYPDVDDFDALMENYVKQLSPKKQDKALIHAKRAANIRTVLLDKKTTAVGSAQFRFWVKKMFTLLPNDPNMPNCKRRICHEGKPVAVREKLFKILTKAHQKCQHGGRDKTSAQVRKIYSWVPKELISRFVKLCPTCQVRRGFNRGTTSDDDEKSSSVNDICPESPNTLPSSTRSRHSSFAASYTSSALQSPVSLVDCSQTFQNQNRWMTDFHAPPEYEDSATSGLMAPNHMS